MSLRDYLSQMVKAEASDLYLSADAPASLKVHGSLQAITDHNLSEQDTRQIAYQLLDHDKINEFEQHITTMFYQRAKQKLQESQQSQAGVTRKDVLFVTNGEYSQYIKRRRQQQGVKKKNGKTNANGPIRS